MFDSNVVQVARVTARAPLFDKYILIFHVFEIDVFESILLLGNVFWLRLPLASNLV